MRLSSGFVSRSATRRCQSLRLCNCEGVRGCTDGTCFVQLGLPCRGGERFLVFERVTEPLSCRVTFGGFSHSLGTMRSCLLYSRRENDLWGCTDGREGCCSLKLLHRGDRNPAAIGSALHGDFFQFFSFCFLFVFCLNQPSCLRSLNVCFLMLHYQVRPGRLINCYSSRNISHATH